MLSTEEKARILEVNVGTVAETIRKERPELRRRIGREWTKERYQRHRRARARQFINEQVEILDQVMSAGDYRYLILAGDPRVTARIEKALLKHLSAGLVSTVCASGNDKTTDILAATLAAFVKYEENACILDGIALIAAAIFLQGLLSGPTPVTWLRSFRLGETCMVKVSFQVMCALNGRVNEAQAIAAQCLWEGT